MLCRRAASTFRTRTFIGVARPAHPWILSAAANDDLPAPRTLSLRHFTPSRPVAIGAFASTAFTIGAGLWICNTISLVAPARAYWVFDHLVMPVVRMRGTEKADRFVRGALATGLLPDLPRYDSRLEDCRSEAEGVHVLRQFCKPPLGVAAAMDPGGKALNGLARLGTTHVEIGPITLKPQEGDVRAHIHALRVGDRTSVDSYVIPSEGVIKTYCQLKKWRETDSNKNEVLFVHVAPNHDSGDPAKDIRRGMDWLKDVASYFVVSFPSSTLQLPSDKRKEAMARFCTDIGAKLMDPTRHSIWRDGRDMPKPLLLKLSPDLSSEQLHDIAFVALSHDIVGLVVCGNVRAGTASARDGKTSRTSASGNDLKEVSTRMVRKMYALTEGKLPIIASGGVATADDAYEKIRAGASLVQVGQALLIDHGLGSVFKLREGLIDLAYADYHKKLEHAIGADHQDCRTKYIEDT